MATEGLPELRWGIIGCGLISSWFVTDLVVRRESATTSHIIQAIGSSSTTKGSAFVTANCSLQSPPPKVYTSYSGVYNDPAVDIVYIGTPHALHLANALAAIDAGKHVLCEKPLTINAADAKTLVEAARRKGVFLMEGVWTRFFPIAANLKTLLHEDRILGAINRVFTDFALYMPLSKLPPDSRTADPTLGAGVLLDIGIYTLTWAALVLESHPAHIAVGSPAPNMISSMTIKNGVDETTSVVLNYPHLQAQAVCTSTMCYQGAEEFCRIEGEHGSISIGGIAASSPSFLVIRLRGKEERRIDFPKERGAKGFYWEADAVAADLRDGRLESGVMPLQETVRMMGLLDAVRESNGLKYVQDD